MMSDETRPGSGDALRQSIMVSLTADHGVTEQFASELAGRVLETVRQGSGIHKAMVEAWKQLEVRVGKIEEGERAFERAMERISQEFRIRLAIRWLEGLGYRVSRGPGVEEAGPGTVVEFKRGDIVNGIAEVVSVSHDGPLKTTLRLRKIARGPGES